jgi:hypothetical protein
LGFALVVGAQLAEPPPERSSALSAGKAAGGEDRAFA